MASESLAGVSISAELVFWKLLIACDEYGRLDARPRRLRARLYSMRPDVDTKETEAWLAELEEDGCVLVYTADGERVIQLTRWERYRSRRNRAAKSKLRGPDGSFGPFRPSDDGLTPHLHDSAESGGSPRSSAGFRLGVQGFRGSGGQGRAARARAREIDQVEWKGKAKAAEWALPIAEQLRDHLASVKGAQLPRTLDGWAKEIGRIQGATPEEITQAVEWLFSGRNEGEFEIIVQSGRALREKFGRIVAAMERTSRSPASTSSLMSAKTEQVGRDTDRKMELLRLSNELFIREPTEHAFDAWTKAGKPRRRAWWDPEGLFVPNAHEPVELREAQR